MAEGLDDARPRTPRSPWYVSFRVHSRSQVLRVVETAERDTAECVSRALARDNYADIQITEWRPSANPCPFTHTCHWCGHSTCRDS